MNGGDNLWYIPTTISLLQDGDIELSEYDSFTSQFHEDEIWINDMKKDVRLYKIGDEFRNFFPLGTSLMCLPGVWIYNRIHPISEADNPLVVSLKISRVCASIFATLSVFFIILTLQNLIESKSIPFIIGGVFAFTSPHFSTHAASLWSHNPSVFLIIFSLWLLTIKKGEFSFFSALPLGLGFITRPDMALTIIMLSIYILVFRRKQILKYVIGGSCLAVPFFLFSYLQYHSFLPPYYMSNRLDSDLFLEALLGNLFSPNRGLFVFSPIFIFSIIGTAVVWVRRKKYDPLYRFISFLPLLHWLTISSFPHWWGGHSYGPRLFVLMLPYLVLLLVPAFQCMVEIKYQPLKIIMLSVFTLFSFWGGFVQLQGVTQQSVHDWNSKVPNVDLKPQKLWHWDDMQIFSSEGPQ